jgi:amino acid permease
MSKYISVYGLFLMGCVMLFFLFANLFDGGNDAATAILTFGIIIVLLILFLIAQMFYLLDLIKKRKL